MTPRRNALDDFRAWLDAFAADPMLTEVGVVEWCLIAGKVAEFRREAALEQLGPYSGQANVAPVSAGYGWVTWEGGQPFIAEPETVTAVAALEDRIAFA